VLKLYRSDAGEVVYWEVWDSGDSSLTVHWGRTGTTGESKEVSLEHGEDAEERITTEASQMLAGGYREWPEDELATIVVQYPLERHKRVKKGIEKRMNAIELRVNETLGWTGLGHCADVDYSVEFTAGVELGQLTVIARAVDAAMALEAIRTDLAAHDLLAGAVIAIEQDDEYVVQWPEAEGGRVII
jgi:predicted DNA-binding WGR domain protein